MFLVGGEFQNEREETEIYIIFFLGEGIICEK